MEARLEFANEPMYDSEASWPKTNNHDMRGKIVIYNW